MAAVVQEPVLLMSQPFAAASVRGLRHAVAEQLAELGAGGAAEDFLLAVQELMTNAVLHGGGAGRLELRRVADVVVCEIIDHGAAAEVPPVRLPGATQPGGRGLWLAHHLTGTLMLTRRADGITASVSICMTPSSGLGGQDASSAPGDDSSAPAAPLAASPEPSRQS